MTDLIALKVANTKRWAAASVLPSRTAITDEIAHDLVTFKPRYETVTAKTGVPWPVIAVIHERESSQSWTASLAQGDPWNKASIHVPKHRGPFASWEEAAEDALVICPPHASKWTDWTIGGALTLLEQYNGLGYAGKGKSSPYIWSSTNQYVRGKYIADGHYDPSVVDRQVGCAAMLMRMTLIDPTIAAEWVK